MSDTDFIFEQHRDTDTFGGRFFRAREAAGLSVKDIASRLSVNIATVDTWQNDRSVPSARRLATLAGLVGVSLSWLLHGVGAAPQSEQDQSGNAALADHLDRLKLLQSDVADVIVQIEKHIDSRADAA